MIIQYEAGVVHANTKVTAIGKTSVTECIFLFAEFLAKTMNTDGYLMDVVSEQDIFQEGAYLNPTMKMSKEQINKFKKYFSTHFDPSLYRSEEEYQKYKIGRDSCVFLKRHIENGFNKFTFVHKEFFDYFATLLPSSKNGRRREIIGYLWHPSISPQQTEYSGAPISAVPLQSKVESTLAKTDITSVNDPEMLKKRSPTMHVTVFFDTNKDSTTAISQTKQRFEVAQIISNQFLENNPGAQAKIAVDYSGLFQSSHNQEEQTDSEMQRKEDRTLS